MSSLSAEPSPERLSRHYYDVAKLYQSPIGEQAVRDLGLLSQVVKHKNLFFPSKWASYDTATRGSFRLVPSVERRTALEADYRAMRENMIFGESYSFEELLGVLSELEANLNG